MAMVVGLSTIITQETHRVVLGNMLRMSLHKLLGAIPQGRDGLHILLEHVIINIAEELDAWLNSPVPFVIEHQWLTEEEA
jgi:hypothetical protein